ncbi:hypothetical protein JXA40_01825 [bacterium]|nr:hypothetical protein [candidate division CSSED10-310 bacterium]
MMQKKWFLMICILFAGTMASSAWIGIDGAPEGTEPDVAVLKSDSGSTILEIDVHGFYSETVEIDGREYRVITMPGCTGSITVGAPLVPRLLAQVGIPDQTEVTIREISRQSVTLPGYNLFPAQRPMRDDQMVSEFVIDDKFYTLVPSYPENTSQVSDPAIWRDIRLVTATVYPIIAHPGTETIDAADRITIELMYSGQSRINVKNRTSNEISPDWESIYRSSIINFDALNLETRDSRDVSVRYLIIADDALLTAIQPLADWWMRAGLNPVIRPVSEVGSTTTLIKDEIYSYYLNEGTEYVLLVGELAAIPAFSFSGGIGDYDYTCLEGGDYYPEMAGGRIITDDPGVVTHVVTRVLNYIQNPPADGWVEKTMLCAHEEQYPGKYTECKNWIKDYPYSIQIPIFETYYPPEGATHAQVKAAMEEGRGIVNYRGHGSTTAWVWSPDWSVSDCHSLNNGPYTPVVWNIACDNGEIDSSSECLAEAWQNAGSAGEGGAVVNLAATRSSYTVENHDFDKRLYLAPFDEGVTRVGDVCNLGRETMVAMSSNGIYNARIYIVFGDPAMDITTLGPFEPVVDHLPTIPMGGADYSVTVSYMGSPVENALVCIWKDTEVYEAGLTDASGTIIFSPIISTGGEMKLTVTAHNYLPYTADVQIAAAGCGAILLNKAVYNCNENILIRVWDTDLNLNPGAQDTAVIDIASDSEPTPETVILTETGNDTAEFHGTIQTSATEPGLGYLLLAHGDAITAHYYDEDCDGAPQDVYDTAVADCVGPVISNVTMSNLGTDQITISWTTDELSDSVVMWGLSTPPDIEASETRMVTEHEIDLEGLEECTPYYFYVMSTDAGGNEAIDDNGGAYYSFVTLKHYILFEENMDADPGWTISGGQWAWGQPTGGGGYYGNPDPTSGYTGSNVIGYNLNGDYSNNMPAYYITTNSFDCSAATEVNMSFYRWLGVESSSWDHAVISVSNNGGSSWTDIWANPGSSMSDADWTFVEYDISDVAAGYDDVMIRWQMGATDTSVYYCGWNIDDVVVGYVAECVEPTPTMPPTSTPTVSPPTDTPVPPTSTPVPPTDTPVPPTDTPVPPTDTPVPPTETPIPPTNTPIPTFTPVPPTDTPVPPTDTPVPPTDTPVPPTNTPVPPTDTPTIPDQGMELIMTDTDLQAGDEFHLYFHLHNPESTAYDTDVYLLLGVYGSYWCWPSWDSIFEHLDYQVFNVPEMQTVTEEVLQFTWPAGVGTLGGLEFIGCAFEPGSWNMIGTLQYIMWSYS